jgi:hypothetical protein
MIMMIGLTCVPWCIFYSFSCFNTLNIACKRHVDAYSDPTWVTNGCWGQKIDHFLGLINSNNTKLTLPIIIYASIFYSFSWFDTLCIACKRHVEAHYDQTWVPNGCWDQKMDHFLWSHKFKNYKNYPTIFGLECLKLSRNGFLKNYYCSKL